MKEKITQLSREHFEYELPKLLCSKKKLEIEVETGHAAKGVFVIGNLEGRYMKGLLYSSSHLLCLEQTSFTGSEATIEYTFHAEDIRGKDTVKGAISIVSSCGEMELLFEINVIEKCIEASFGEVRDLFHFTNLAKLDWSNAVSIFRTQDFKDIFLKKDTDLCSLYEGLIAGENYEQALEEFLISIQKKDYTKIAVAQTEYTYQVKREDVSGKIVVEKDNWGYLDVEILSDSDFLQIEKSRLQAIDFIGSTCEVFFEVKNEKLRAGKNYAVVVLRTMYQEVTLQFQIEKVVKRMERDYEEAKIRKCEIIIVNSYINFRSNRIAVSEYTMEMRNTLTKLEGMLAVKRNLGELGYSRRLDLYQMHLYMVEGQNTKAQEILNSLEEEKHLLKKNTIVDYCGYLYLKALFSRKEYDLQQALIEIKDCYKQKKDAWQILWFLLFLDEKYEQDPKEKIRLIQEQFELGCTSPVLYYEICNVLEQDPTLLSELTPCMIQAVNMGVKQWLFSEGLAIQYAYLAEREKGYNRVIMSNLVAFYEKYKLKDVLAAICSILIKCDVSDNSCFAWYEEGVEAQLRMTQLYEYYMYSIDENYKGLLPQEVYMYFSYNTNLLEKKKAFLFANIVSHQKELPEVYPLYEDQIKAYVLSQLQKGKINQHMAVLYRKYIQEYNITSSVAKDLPKVLFKHRVHCEHKEMEGVIVLHKECPEEVYVPFGKDGAAYVDIYTENAKVLLVDRAGRRYESSIKWSIEKLMRRTQLAEACFNHCPGNKMICLFIYEKMEYFHKREISIVQLQRYMDNEWLKPEYRKKWLMRLIQNYYDNYEGEALEALLLEVDIHGMKRSERNLITEYCIIRGLYDLAYEQIKEYSFEGVSVKRLRALCSKMIKKKGMEIEDPLLAKMSFFVFHAGKYDENILKYLVRYYLGTTKNMFLVWREAKEYELDTVDLEERLLGQILFAESYVQDAMAVFYNFYKAGRNRTLVKAFISYYSYKYLVRDRVVDTKFFDIVKKELQIEENKTATYALLKYYSTLPSWNKEMTEFIKGKVEESIENGVIFPFFKEFTRSIKFPGGLENMKFIEYKTDPSHNVILHYFVEDEEMSEKFETLHLTNVYEGIFVYPFMLFYNETMQYYIEETSEKSEPIITESITVRGDAEFTDAEEDTFGHINTMLVAREMKDEETLLTLLRNYEKTEYAFDHAFRMLE